jgi:flavin reductase (DIM6/NTAB) family NADH-FMN oxidoreductase RutF
MARRIIRDYTNRSTESDFGLADVDEISLKAIDEELRWYLTRSRPTYARFSEDHKPVSDLVVDGTKSPEEIAEMLVECIANKNKNHIKKSLPLIRHFNPLTLFLYGTYKADGTPNFGLFSWLNYCIDDGVGVIACIAGEKLTKDRIRANKVFSANLVTEELLPFADYFGNTPGYKQGKMNIPVETIKGQVLDVPILKKSPWTYELEVTQSFELEGSTLFIYKVRNVFANESIYDEPENVERWMNIIRPIQSVRQSYFKWDGTAVGSFGEPMKAIKTLDKSRDT